MENTYVIGGCDSNGAPVYNELTKLFIRATVEEKIIYPKMMCRYSSESPKEYLDSINKAIISGVSVMMYQNDEAVIASLHLLHHFIMRDVRWKNVVTTSYQVVGMFCATV